MKYEDLARAGVLAYQKSEAPLLLAIESSCDETAAAVLAGARDVRAMTVYTQIPLHRKYGGVVPELACGKGGGGNGSRAARSRRVHP